MTVDLVITRARLERDLDGILAVDAETFTNPWTREMYEWEARRSDVSRLFVVYPSPPGLPMDAAESPDGSRDVQLIAYCAVWFIFDELHINNLAVHPHWRRRGVARRLLEHVLKEGRLAGAAQATLEVRRSNTPALTLYEGLGFSVGGVRADYYTEPSEDALILWRRPVGTGVGEAGPDSSVTDPVA
jgi:ribosomal-protein-alanine N-acetyltransferase